MKTFQNNNDKIKTMVICALFAALIAVGAFIRIPTVLIPFTLQTFFVLMCGMMLGSKRAALASAVYVLIGLVGIPIFASGGGPAYVLQPTFGYIIAFIPASFLIGKVSEAKSKPSFLELFVAGLMGIILIYLIGVTYFVLISHLYLGQQVSLQELLANCFLLLLPGDIIKCILAALVSSKLVFVVRSMLTK